MFARSRKFVLATFVAGALSAASTLPAYAVDPMWGYNSTPRLPDNSLDFSGWTPLGSPADATVLGSLAFTRNAVDYTVTVKVPSVYGTRELHPLFANVILNNTTGVPWTYSYQTGQASTSVTEVRDNIANQIGVGCVATRAFYTKAQTDNLAVAQTADLWLPGDCGNAAVAPQLRYSEVLDVSSTGQLIHTVTLTAIDDAPGLADLDFFVGLDEDLNSQDAIPLIKGNGNQVYMETGAFRLYLTMLQGDRMSVGPYLQRNTPNAFIDVSTFAPGATVITGMDTYSYYALLHRNIAPGTSVTLGFSEALYAPEELVAQTVNVAFVDDTTGAAVTPVAGTVTTYTGMPGTAVGFTQAMAEAAMPAGYTFVSLDNVATFDFDGATDQTITVHLASPPAEQLVPSSQVPAGGTVAPSGALAAVVLCGLGLALLAVRKVHA